ncbi:tetratricopeptide repeat protein [Nostoc spongiaeforme FACHB-130]|uniref:Tetratricopeptide repeat protein n=1 Tax=Nostoc spongiaeforme FACHB-130 TaxID=1357510 RepID=A0ABR8FUY3_9NOSO|nr:tetratricopeptide repeat protein [Nostoc spongiaeforme]MBD2595260.1 tetratricopeptide repeat protein [Nostoc spongiaeforme FACHB-130]
MQKILISILAACVYLTPLTVTLIAQPSWGETKTPQAETAKKLLEQARQKLGQQEYQRAIPLFQQVLTMARELKDQKLEALGLHELGFCYNALGEKQQALSYYNQALPLLRAVGNRADEARTLNNIGKVYSDLGEKQQALSYYNQALPLSRAVGDHAGETTTLANIGGVYNDLGEKQKALSFYNQALPLYRAVGDRSKEGTILNNIGGVYNDLGEKQQALSFYNQALLLSRAVGDRSGEARTLNNIGLVYNDLGEKQQALSFYNQALPLYRAVGNRAGEATTLNNIGAVYNDLGEKQQALSFYNQALPLYRAVDNRSGEATTLNNIGAVYNALGEKQQALSYLNQALPLYRAVGDRFGEAATLNNIGGVYSTLGEKQQALSYYNQALPLLRAVSNRSGEARILTGIGGVYNALGEKQQALSFYNQALPLYRAVGDRMGEATTLNNIGLVYSDLGEQQQALSFYNQALPLYRAVGDRAGEATTLNNIGGVYSDLGEQQQALSFLNQALPLSRAVGDRTGEATTLNNIGLVYSDLGEQQQALSFYNQALPLYRAVGDRSGEANTLGNRGILFQNTNRSSEGITDLEKSLQISLELRRGLQQENRQKFLQQNDWSATALVNVLIDQKKYDQALVWVNLFSTADLADYNRLINAKVANPEAQKAIDKWNQKNQQLESQRQQLQNNFLPDFAQKFRQLETQIYQEATNISRQFPEVAELFETTPADVDKLKSSIPANTVVIQPVLLKNVRNISNSLAIFILTNNKVTVIKTSINPNEFDQILTQYLEQLEDDSDFGYAENSIKLYDILIRPVEAEIQKLQPKQLSIIATGKLRYLPFETLYDIKTEQYLIEKYPVNYLTRISTSSLGSPKATTNQAPKVLAFGNPVPHHPQNLQGAETEVKEITNKLPGSEAYLGSKATLANFKNQALRFNFVHLATHGCFQDTDCTTFNLKNNSLLFADAQYNIADAALLGLKGTQLLTLSACQTAKKIEDKGLGISGVAYIFERAGAKAVMAGLWSVDDKETPKLMIDFYVNLQQGMTKGEALQKAKLQQIKRHPYYWSPFVIIGDVR